MSASIEADIEKYEKQLLDDPKSRVFVPLSDCYRRLGRYDEAITVAKQGLEVHPNYFGAKVALARSYFENGEIEPAKGLLESILTFAPDNLLATRILSQIYVLEGHKEKAIPCLKRLLALEPQDEQAKAQLEALERNQTDAPAQDVTTEEEPSKSEAMHVDAQIPITAQEPTSEASVSPFDEEKESIEFNDNEAPFELSPMEGEEIPLDEEEAAALEIMHNDSANEQQETSSPKTITLAQMYEEQGHLQEALEIYHELSNLQPQDEYLRNKLLVLSRLLGDRESDMKVDLRKVTAYETMLGRIQERRRAL